MFRFYGTSTLDQTELTNFLVNLFSSGCRWVDIRVWRSRHRIFLEVLGMVRGTEVMRHLMLSVLMINEAVEGNVHTHILRWRPNQGRLPGGGNYWDNVE